jgi:hypothetical protein
LPRRSPTTIEDISSSKIETDWTFGKGQNNSFRSTLLSQQLGFFSAQAGAEHFFVVGAFAFLYRLELKQL